MKKLGIHIISGLAAAILVACGGGPDPLRHPSGAGGPCDVPMAPGGYCVKGNQILDETGTPRIFRGVNRPSLEFDFYGKKFCKADFEKMRSWRVDVVRIPLSQAYWHLNDDYKTRVEEVVAMAREADLDVILDLHWSTKDNTGAPGMQDLPDTYSVKFWRELAPLFKDDGRVIYELYNEPRRVSWKHWRKGGRHPEGWTMVGMQQLYDTVRETGAHNLVIIGGIVWAYDLSGIKRHPIDGYNIAYTTHLYPYVGKMPQDWDAAWRSLVDIYPIIITEFGPEGDVKDLQYVKEVVDTAERLNIGWIAWAWFPLNDNHFFTKFSPEGDVYEITPYGNLIKALLSSSR